MADTIAELAGLLKLGPDAPLQPPRFAKVAGAAGDTVTVTLGGSNVAAVKCCVCNVGDVVLLETMPSGQLAAVARRGGFPRVQVSVNTSGVWHYYPLAHLPASSSSLNDMLILDGRIGGYSYNSKSAVRFIVSNRGALQATAEILAQSSTGATMADIFTNGDFFVYQNGDGSVDVYYGAYNYSAADFDIILTSPSQTYGSTQRGQITYDGTYTTTPTGTLFCRASTASNRVALLDGSLLLPGGTVGLQGAAMTRAKTSSQALAADNTYEVVALQSDVIYGDGLSASGNGVLVGTGVTHVKVSYNAVWGTMNGAGRRTIRTYKNVNSGTNIISNSSEQLASGTEYHAIAGPPVIAAVTPGDVIYMAAYGKTGDSVFGSANGAGTYLTVEALR